MNVSDSATVLKIPEHCVVNSRGHMRKYNAKLSLDDYDASFFRASPNQARAPHMPRDRGTHCHHLPSSPVLPR
eukprot:445604-Prymnesium_polylepis.1